MKGARVEFSVPYCVATALLRGRVVRARLDVAGPGRGNHYRVRDGTGRLVAIARVEGLTAHARAIEMRLTEEKQ